jgi:hypothetical protein
VTPLDPLVRAAVVTAEMTWDTWWALVLGFALSGALEAFVDETTVSDALGGDEPRDLGLAALLGAASSSCSYSAVGTTRTLFAKGASGAASFVFMFASTDLVVELGLVTLVLLGWQFVVGEYVGGVVAAAVVGLLVVHAVPDDWIERAREHARAVGGITCGACDADTDPDAEATVAVETATGIEYFCCDGCRRVFAARDEADRPLRERLTSRDGWRSAARATMSDWEMLWDDIAVGFVVAGLASALVPAAWWTALFPAESGLGGVLVATGLAVLVGAATFMCSVGNVPFALVLWQRGLPFGSVLAFVYADLLVPPLVNVYRRHYGVRFAAALTAVLAVAAFVAGVVVHYAVGGLAPPAGSVGGTVPDGYTLVLNLLFTPVFCWQAYAAFGVDGCRDRLRAGWARVVRVAGTAVALGVAVLAVAVATVRALAYGTRVAVALARALRAGGRAGLAVATLDTDGQSVARTLQAAAAAGVLAAYLRYGDVAPAHPAESGDPVGGRLRALGGGRRG